MKNPEISYKITSVSEDEIEVDAKVDGEDVRARVMRTVIEAVSSDGSMGHTFRVANVDREKFKVGGSFVAKLVPDS